MSFNIDQLPWIKTAKSYMGLKEIPGIKHNQTILTWLKNLKAWWSGDEQPWCFTGDTEIFTKDGWIRLDQIKDDAVVYQANAFGELSLTPIIKRIEKDYSGDIFKIKHRNLNLQCDVGHRWWGLFDSYKPEYRFDTLDNLKDCGLTIPAVFSGNKDCGLTTNQLWLLAAFISDGKVRYSEAKNNTGKKVPRGIEFEVSRNRKIETLMALQPKHTYTQKKAYGPLTKKPLTVFSFDYPEYFYDCFSDYKILSNDFINSLSVKDARTFIDAYCVFDGSGLETLSSTLYTSDEANLRNLISILTLAGYHICFQINNYGSEFTKKTAYRLIFNRDKENRHIKKEHVERSYFEGKLYCVQVPEGRIVVRSKNSSPIVTGNCGTYVGECFRANGMIYPKMWMRAKDWGTWGIMLPKPIPGCVVVFERKGGGHVGFYMGETTDGYLEILGGNQGNAVSCAKFSTERVLRNDNGVITGYRWPSEYPLPVNVSTDKLVSKSTVSTNEA